MNFFNNLISVDLDNKVINGLNDELKSIYIYNAFKKSNKPILVVSNSLFESNKIYKSLSCYTKDVLFFPMDDFLTSEALAISPELKITRLETLNTLCDDSKKIVITNLTGLLRFLPLKNIYKSNFINLKVGLEYDMSRLVEDLYRIGYSRESYVNKTGEFAVRGFVLDIFPISSSFPIRLEFFGDEIDEIKSFDLDSQLTRENVTDVVVKPNSEFIINSSIDYKVSQKDLIKFGDVASIYDYLDGLVFYNNYNDIVLGYKNLCEDIFNYNVEKDIDQSTRYMFDLDYFSKFDSYYLSNFDDSVDLNLKSIKYATGNIEYFNMSIDKINAYLNKCIRGKKTVIICLKDRYVVNKVIGNLDNENVVFTSLDNIISNKINLVVKTINSGFEYNNFVVISENEFFNRKNNNVVYKSNFKYGTKIKDISKLEIGDYVVHMSYGIGRYLGLKTLNKNGLMKDFISIEYQGGDKLYIPVENFELINKYSSNDSVVPKLNKLGGSEWSKTKARLRKKINDMTQELLALYAARQKISGFAFNKDVEEQAIFEAEFEFEETADQMRAVEDIKKDMESSTPMDRLLCGDVGFGKTEVAFRAIYKAILSGKQAALLCPTTILSSQHFNNAVDRFKNTGVNIEVLNRFVDKRHVDRILSDVREGRVDLLIGTHRILSDDVVFKDLGLLVVDEEQRFGVKHKEKIKQFKNNIDVLTLTATPIPRTLQMSIAGIRGLSLIETPPCNRYPVQTYVLAESNQIIKEAVYRELSRDGQVFILFNHVMEMEEKIHSISKIVPDARIGMIHGKMTKNQIEDVMFKFINYEFDVLLCTTIIETGIDIPNVNTLIILDADRFGLSQLYQIRGRVGRSDKIAYCYLMYNNSKILSEIATKRLDVIKQFTELGSGFNIAMRDLSIRGAGDLLGSEQAGFIDSVGIELFLSMLNEEVSKLTGNVVEEKKEKTSPYIDVETAIDDSYTSDVDIKLEIHKKINEIDSLKSLEKVKFELEDRFGKLSSNMVIYMYEELFDSLAHKLPIRKIEQTKNFVKIIFEPSFTNQVKVENLFIDVNQLSRSFRFSMLGKCLVINLDIVYLDKHFIYYLVDLVNLLIDKYKVKIINEEQN